MFNYKDLAYYNVFFVKNPNTTVKLAFKMYFYTVKTHFIAETN